MRGRGGLGNMQRQMQMNEQVKNIGQKIEEKNMTEMKTQIDKFSEKLSEFATKHKEDIKLNPEFRKEFYMMCTEMGVDPLASRSVWSNSLNLAEFYYELAIQIVTISIAIREKKGGLIELEQLKKYLTALRKKDDITDMDITKSIESVSELKCGFQMVTFSNKKKAVITIPIQISNDSNLVLEIAQENKGMITYYTFYQKYNSYSIEMFEEILNQLINNGIVWIDSPSSILDYKKEKKEISECRDFLKGVAFLIYWFPGLLGES